MRLSASLAVTSLTHKLCWCSPQPGTLAATRAPLARALLVTSSRGNFGAAVWLVAEKPALEP